MAAGLDVYNSSGILQFESNSTVYRVLQEGTANTGTAYTPFTISWPVQPVIPMIAVQPPIGCYVAIYIEHVDYVASADSLRWKVHLVSDQSDKLINYKILSRVADGGSSGVSFGLQTFSESGACVFDSGFRYPIFSSSSLITLNYSVVTVPLIHSRSQGVFFSINECGLGGLENGTNDRATHLMCPRGVAFTSETTLGAKLLFSYYWGTFNIVHTPFQVTALRFTGY